MRKLMIAAIAVVGISATGLAQQQVKFGPKAGVNLANLSGMDDTDMKIGFHVGAVAEIKFNDKFSLQPELLYSAQGTKIDMSMDIPMIGKLEFESKTNLDYINIPIMAKYYFVEGFSVEVGPQVSFLIKAEEKAKSDGESETLDIKDGLNSIDFGLGFGLAYDLPQGLFINARYNLGLTDIVKDNNGDAVKNSVIQVGVGFKFD